MIDVAAMLVQDELEEVVDDVLCRGIVTIDRLRRRLETISAKGRPGTRKLWRALDAWADGPAPGSAAEMRLVRRLEAHGVPRPARQHTVHANCPWPGSTWPGLIGGWRWSSTAFAGTRDGALSRRTGP
ncbi:MAG TPA: hypothetical protein VKI64_11325, partial [Acidimicrobiales bacterium]|nr:hypothetical protein [Acidimicrobiales bacterium]